jgi:folate-binding protein YgfZ
MREPIAGAVEGVSSPLLHLLEEAGGVVSPYHDLRLVRHFGAPQAEYEAATRGVAVFDRSHRARLRVSGRAPDQMLDGILTGTLPAAPVEVAEGLWEGSGTYHAVLTPKGKMITDLSALLPGDASVDGFLLDVPVAGRAALVEHLARYLPPRFATVRDVSGETASISVVGPGAPDLLTRSEIELPVDAAWLASSAEGRWRARGSGTEALVVSRTADVWPPAWTVYGPAGEVGELWGALVRAGASAAGLGVWKTLVVEAGRPVFGTDMDETTLPPEAGIVERAIDHTKGCYTGQEVIVRIRDRGHVNRHFRRLVLGEGPAPSPGTPLLAADGTDKVVGTVTSAVESPLLGGVAVFAYVRRGVDRVRVGDIETDVPRHFPEPPTPGLDADD